MESPLRRVGFVGVGSLGLPMAVLTSTVFEVQVVDTDPLASKLAGERGLTSASSLSALADWADCVVTVLPVPDDLFTVAGEPGNGGDTLTGRREEGLLIVDVGSGAPIRTREFASMLHDAGHSLVDAPVSGSPGMAEQAKLIAMVGGAPDAIELATQALKPTCATLLFTGGPGSGHATKLVNNMLAASHLASTIEALLMASAAGFDPATIVPAVNQLTGASYASQVKMEKFVLSGTYDSGFPVRSLMTDLENGAEWFSLLANPPVFCAATYATWSQAAQELGADADHTAVAQWLERRNGVSLAQGQSSHSPGVETTTT